MEALLAYDWPGNVRELIHTVEQAASEARTAPIAKGHLSFREGCHPPPRQCSGDCPGPGTDLENISAAARRPGISRPTLCRRMKEYGVHRGG